MILVRMTVSREQVGCQCRKHSKDDRVQRLVRVESIQSLLVCQLQEAYKEVSVKDNSIHRVVPMTVFIIYLSQQLSWLSYE